MKKLILLSIAVLLVNISVQARNFFEGAERKSNTELYNSIYADFENFYINEVEEEEVFDLEQDELYNDLLNSFEKSFVQETLVDEYEDERNDNLYIELSAKFNCIYTCLTIGEELEDKYNDSLYNSIYNSVEEKA